MSGTNQVNNVRAIINSANRLDPNYSTSGNFLFSFNNPVTSVTKITINSVQIPYTFYAINANNNVLVFNGGATSITIPPGNYTASTIAAELQTLMAAAFPGQSPTVSYSTITFTLTFTQTSAFMINCINTQPTSTAAAMLGFTIDSATATSVTADSVLNISGPNYINIVSKYLTNYIQTKMIFSSNLYTNVLWAIPLGGFPGDVIIYDPKVEIPLACNINIKTTDLIDLQLQDDQGNILNLNGVDWAMELIFTA